jgi:hypothetical protein
MSSSGCHARRNTGSTLTTTMCTIQLYEIYTFRICSKSEFLNIVQLSLAPITLNWSNFVKHYELSINVTVGDVLWYLCVLLLCLHSSTHHSNLISILGIAVQILSTYCILSGSWLYIILPLIPLLSTTPFNVPRSSCFWQRKINGCCRRWVWSY